MMCPDGRPYVHAVFLADEPGRRNDDGRSRRPIRRLETISIQSRFRLADVPPRPGRHGVFAATPSDAERRDSHRAWTYSLQPTALHRCGRAARRRDSRRAIVVNASCSCRPDVSWRSNRNGAANGSTLLPAARSPAAVSLRPGDAGVPQDLFMGGPPPDRDNAKTGERDLSFGPDASSISACL